MSQVPDLGSPCAAPEAPITLSPARQRACLEAAWEIEALALLLPKIELAEQPVAALQLRGVAARVAELAGVGPWKFEKKCVFWGHRADLVCFYS